MSRAQSFSALGFVMFVLLGTGASSATAQPKAPKHALLVACTTYPKCEGLHPLVGPGNDVKLWHTTLTKHFDFPPANITMLVGWEKDEATRPTLANIQAAFEKLIKTAEPGSQIFICLGGHGTRVPVRGDPLDPKNYEPDGLDEVFLPADVLPAGKDRQIPNALKDNDVGEYLDRLRAKGAHVFIVFDCCHSGTMTRGDGKQRIVTRVASPHAMGFNQKEIDDAIDRAKKAVAAAEKAGNKVTEQPKVKTRGANEMGSLIAFYGAQSHECAIELPLPEDPKNQTPYHGLLSFNLNSTLQQRQARLTYADLQQILASQCRVVVGTAGPVPYGEGDLDREVFGYTTWPKPQEIVLTKDGDQLSVSAGSLRGLTPGSILALHPPVNDPRDPKLILGYVEVTGTNVATASVKPVKFDENVPEIKSDAIPELARCTIAARDYGDLRVKLFVQDHPGLKAAFKVLDGTPEGKEVLAMLRLMDKETDADWMLTALTPKQAEADYGVQDLKGDTVFLIRSPGRAEDKAAAQAADKLVAATGKPPPRRLYGSYPLGDPANDPKGAEVLSKLFDRDLPKIFRWQNLWRVAAETGNMQGKNYGAKLDITRQASQDATGPGEVLRGSVPNKSYLDFEIKNEGNEHLWVVPMYLGPQLEIVSYGKTQAVEIGKSTRLPRGQINSKPEEFGTAGLVVFLLPQSTFTTPPNFSFLDQSGLSAPPARISRAMQRAGAPKTPFGALMKSSVVGDGVPRTRNLTPTTATTPGIISGSWTIVP